MDSNSFDSILIFQNIHSVLKAEKILKGKNIFYDVVPVPKEIDSSCGMAIGIKSMEMDIVKNVLSTYKFEVKGIYLQKNGRFIRYE
ncbi:DUF3343 domain-containing protein [candidate division KSB1 bacterium]|nr:MAG: DUF3343 domain-containing protein [candidate division KSB1 bacterium]